MSEAKPVGSNFDNLLRLMIQGRCNPGKTAAIVRLLEDRFI